VEILAADHVAPVPHVVEKAASVLQHGGIVAMRTDTLYGLLASVNRPDGLARLLRLKERPAGKPFVLVAADWIGVRSVTSWLPAVARSLAARHWPGPLTLVLPAAAGLPAEVTAQGRTVAVRVPADPLLRAVVAATRCPVAAPSANREGTEPARSAAEIADVFGREVDLVLDGGPCEGGRPSTIVDCSTRHVGILREGPVQISADEIAER
jgi:L-threonylcarbamoyladenylate synthase